jgi:hypothetical protein
MQHQIITVQRLEAATDLRGAMEATIKRPKEEGQPEGSASYGSVFVQRAGEPR